MNLADRIEKRRFVGSEFLVWLWFESELFEGRFDVEGFGPCELWLEGQITLAEGKEQSRLKGATPSAAPEAREALRQGKLPTQARLRLSRGELEFGFVWSAAALSLAAVKIPSVVKEEADEQFYERMYLLEDLEAIMASLYAKFLGLRLSPAWDEAIAPAIRSWVRGDAAPSAEAYRRARARQPSIGHGGRRATTPPPGAAGADDAGSQRRTA
jgi:hypothetical protein